MDAFGKVKYFRDLTPANILDFDAWLRVGKGIDYQNTIYGYHKRIKVYVNEAIQYGYLNDNPYTKVKIPRGEESKIRYLTQKEVDAIRNADIEDASLGPFVHYLCYKCTRGLVIQICILSIGVMSTGEIMDAITYGKVE